MLVSLYMSNRVKIVQKGAGEIQAKYNFKKFPSKLLISDGLTIIVSNWITSQEPDKAYNTIKWEKKTARTPENIAPVRDSVGRLRSPCSYVPQLKSNGAPPPPPPPPPPPGAYLMNCFKNV